MSAELEALEVLVDVASNLPAPETEAEGERALTLGPSTVLRVAIVGLHGVGKSTMVNLVLGRPAVPSGAGASTRTAVRLLHGSARDAVVHFDDETRLELRVEDALAWIVGQRVPEGRSARTVDLFVASDWARGLELTDTPGIDLASARPRSTVDMDAIDAVILVTRGPSSAFDREVRVLRAVTGGARCRIGVVTCEGVAEAERLVMERDVAAAFSRNAITTIGPILPVRIDDSTDPLTRESIASLRVMLAALSESRGCLRARREMQHGVERVAAALTTEIELRLRALATPEAAARDELDDLRRALATARTRIDAARVEWRAREDRLGRELDVRRASYLRDQAARAVAALDGELQRRDGRVLDVALAARAACDEMLERWRGEERALVERRFLEAAEWFVRTSDDVIADLRARSHVELPAQPHEHAPRSAVTIWRAGRGPVGAEHRTPSERPPPREAIASDAARDVTVDYLSQLFVARSWQTMHELVDRYVAARRVLEHDILRFVSSIEHGAERALLGAVAANRAGGHRVASEVRRLRALRAQISAVMSDWSADAAS